MTEKALMGGEVNSQFKVRLYTGAKWAVVWVGRLDPRWEPNGCVGRCVGNRDLAAPLSNKGIIDRFTSPLT